MSALMQSWHRMDRFPFGRFFFNRIIALRIPYTGSIRPRVVSLEPGKAMVEFSDRRAVRNHLHSIHAIALMNLAEFSTGLAMMSGQPANVRAILVGLSIEYLKKARGTMRASCLDELGPFHGSKREERRLTSEITNEEGEVVARAEAKWLMDQREAYT